jgi:thiol-disulfide isomerase/thioredoxin
MKFSKTVAAVVLAAMAGSASAAQPKVGKPVPDTMLVLADGTKVHLSELRGQIVVLNLWATWCVPCRTELPLLDGYYRVARKHGWPLRVFAVATEDGVPKYKLTSLFKLLAITQTDRIRSSQFDDQDGLPTNYVIDKAGILRYAKAGAFDIDKLNDVIVPLVNEPAPAR